MNPDRTTRSSPPPRTSGGTFYQLQIVIGVAFVLATLFTAWTEPGLLPSNLAGKLERALEQQENNPQQVVPTLTARPQSRIGIVAGHSGNDSGAVCADELGGFREVDINLTVANKVRENLIAEGYEVDLLAEYDNRLYDYRSLALVSVHADSCEYINDQAKGYKVAVTMSNNYPEQSQRLANCLRTRYGEVTQMEYHPGSITADMTSYHAFGEIDDLTPAAIIEVGFMNLDREILTQQPDLLARGITDGILCFVRNEDVSGISTPTP